MRKLLALLVLGMMAGAGSAAAEKVTVSMNLVNAGGTGDIIGLIVFEDTDRGVRIDPDLRGLTDGQHGIHVHENPNCGPADRDGTIVPGLAAGSHYDPQQTGMHEGPNGNGHLGDLPVLYVNEDGTATRASWAPRLTVADMAGRAIVIHSGGDNYSDVPKKLGGGGSRVACGLVVE